MADLSKETERCLSLYGIARSMHQERWAEWRRIAAHCLPWQEHWWIGDASPGDGNTQAWSQFDPVGSQAIQRQSSRLVHYTTPAGQRWHTLEPEDLRLLKHRDVQIYVSAVSDTLTGLEGSMNVASTMKLLAAIGSWLGEGPAQLGAFVGEQNQEVPGTQEQLRLEI